MRACILICLTFLWLYAPTLRAQERAFPSVKTLMAPDDFRAAGLTKLTDAELRNLDLWISKFADVVSRVAQSQPAPQTALAPSRRADAGTTAAPLTLDALEGAINSCR